MANPLFRDLQGQDAYAVLDVPTDSDVAAIKQAHRRLILAWHPDKHRDSERLEQAEQITRLANLALRILLNFRDDYNRHLGLERRPHIPPEWRSPWDNPPPPRPGPSKPPPPADPPTPSQPPPEARPEPETWRQPPPSRPRPNDLVRGLRVLSALGFVAALIFLAPHAGQLILRVTTQVGAPVPEAMGGQWIGTGVTSSGEQYVVRLSLTPGYSTGSATYPLRACTAVLTPVSAEGQAVTVEQQAPSGCTTATALLRPSASGLDLVTGDQVTALRPDRPVTARGWWVGYTLDIHVDNRVVRRGGTVCPMTPIGPDTFAVGGTTCPDNGVWQVGSGRATFRDTRGQTLSEPLWPA
ncbi:J domain-containing protein [Nonomuraea soli]|uniref:J domain-containing protein n=1 Tax=Nonomuraea soli TaxID=1032476 RepID=A0A7W0CP41_9ACTN|nr:J domain-containing protein [Nonomuraea soli]MBA2894741.1 hypothetical protein [Nonomuraea soli]